MGVHRGARARRVLGPRRDTSFSRRPSITASIAREPSHDLGARTIDSCVGEPGWHVVAFALPSLWSRRMQQRHRREHIPVVTIPDTGTTPQSSDGAATTAAGGLDSNAPITLGSVSLDPCKDVTGAWCGSVDVPLDRSHPDGDQLYIGVELHPRTDVSTKSEGTIVAIEGGPGFSSTGSAQLVSHPFRADHRPPRPPAHRRPRHGPVVSGWDLPDRVAAGRRLDRRRERLREADGQLGGRLRSGNRRRRPRRCARHVTQGHIDLYGDSYGTFVAQAFAARHGDLLTTLVLDSAFPVTGGDPFHASRVPAMLRAFDAVSAGAPRTRHQGTPTSERITALLNRCGRCRSGSRRPTRMAIP